MAMNFGQQQQQQQADLAESSSATEQHKCSQFTCAKCRKFIAINFNWNCHKMKRKGSASVWRIKTIGPVILDTVIFFFIVALLALSFSGVIKPRGAGFYCDDNSITHQYKGDTITATQLLCGAFLGPLLFFIPVELVHLLSSGEKSNCLKIVKKLLSSIWRRWRVMLVGLLITLTVTEIAKGIVSEPRPHFWDTCKPNVTETQCQKGYISDFNCTSGLPSRVIRDAQKSFPSGHASLSVFASCFMMWYFQSFVTWSKSFTLVPCLHFVWFMFGSVCSLTRITDRRHHWWDVLAGTVLGIAICFLVTKAQRRRDTFPRSGKGDQVDIDNYSGNSKEKVSRLISTSTVSTSMPEDREMDYVNQEP